MRALIKKTLPKILPPSLYDFLRKRWIFFKIKERTKKAYLYDLNRYMKHSDLLGLNSSQNLIGKIIREYHVIEKGLTMPETRLGFGREMILKLSDDCIAFIEKYGTKEKQLIHAIGVLKEYKVFHENQNFQLDDDIISVIEDIQKINHEIEITSQKEMTKKEFFEFVESPFPEFANSRASVRNYSDSSVSEGEIILALEKAKTTPSACNRQCWRTYLYTNKKQINAILEVQGGNRGFGHLADKLIVIAAETGVFTDVGERNQAFIDGGMYAMNLLYALHHQKIATCILNCSNTIEKDIKLREVCNIKESEVFIALIACGNPPENFKIAASKRYDLSNTNTVI